jgi:isoleucyl-tRNA synthetase
VEDNQVSEENNNSQAFSFVKMEKDILRFWQEDKSFQKSLEKTKDCPPYIFYDGPPFATGLPHHGHILAGTLKDIIPRYFTMKGRYIERRFGWDCHGLPVEYEIDKKYKMSAHDNVKKIGVAAYNNECRSIVQKFTSEWRKTVERMGRWVDFDNDYKTMDPDFMESVWNVVKQLWEKDLIYRGNKIMPYSTELGTPLSNFEAGQNYQDVQDPAVTVGFKLEDEEASILAWTTTPWTLPSNLGLCVRADIDYAFCEEVETGNKYYIAESRVDSYNPKSKKKKKGKKESSEDSSARLKVLKTIKGSELVGKKYTPLFPYFKDLGDQGAFQIFEDNYVTTDDGTGIVHLAPSFGDDDNRVMKEANVHLFACPLDEQGRFTSLVNDYANLYVKDADKLIIKNLKDNGSLFHQDVLVHSYPFCYRSNTPLIYRSIPSWFVKVETIKDKLIKNNQQINWVPDHIKEGRFGKWLEGARDWAISRNRVWGTPIPIWENKTTKKYHCIGSIEELEKLTGTKVTDLHRENVDHLKFQIEGEEGTYERISEVLDCWFESGSMPYAQLHYPFENRDVFEKGFPAEFIAEGLDQTRGWFYTLTVLATALFDKPAFKNVIVNGMIMANDGKKMSKSLKNFTPPDDILESYGADALRLYMITSGLVRGEELRFSDENVKDMVRRAILPWFNAFNFFKTYAEVDGFCPEENFKLGENILDKWLLSKLQTLKASISEEMEQYKLYNVVPSLLNFIEDLTNWYIRLNRSRYWESGLEDDKKEAYSTLYVALKELSMLMAPFTPFLSDYLFQELQKLSKKGITEVSSVHLEDYPVSSKELINSKLEDAVDRMQQVILLGRQKRNQVSIKTKTPLSRLTIIHKDQDLLDKVKDLENYVKSELNIKKVEYSTNENEYIDLYAKANSPVLGKKLGKEFGQYRKLIESLTPEELENLETEGTVTINGKEFEQSEILVFRGAKENTEALSNRYISIDIDCQLNDELIKEGLAREIVNRIQKRRKERDFNVSDRISISYFTNETLQQAINENLDYITKETLATNLAPSESKLDVSLAANIDDHEFLFEIQKDNA